MSELNIITGSSKYSKLIWQWRNDPVTREYSFCNKYINWEEHNIWYKNVLEDISTKLFIGEINNKPVGVIRFSNFKENKSVYEININIAPIYRGKGIGKKLLKKGILKLIEHDKKFDTIIANVKTSNTASKALFKKNGFILLTSEKDKCCLSFKIK